MSTASDPNEIHRAAFREARRRGDPIAAARAAAQALRERVTTLGKAETAAHRYYTDAALNEPLADLYERFTNVHKGLRKLFPDYRRDKKAVAAFTATVALLGGTGGQVADT